jgi:hypothetical protein
MGPTIPPTPVPQGAGWIVTTLIVLEPVLASAMSGLPSPLKSATASAKGSAPPTAPRPGLV